MISAKEQPGTTPFNADPLAGQMLDADAHMYLTAEQMLETLGDLGASPDNYEFFKTYPSSEEYKERRLIAREKLWEVKGMAALGAVDPVERREAIDLMGMRSQLMFSNVEKEMRVDSQAAREATSRYNDFVLDFARASDSKGRARAVCHMNMHDPEWACKELDRLLKKGALAVTLPCHAPPAGVSPSHSVWDPFWARLEEARVPATLHLANAGLLYCRTPEDLMFPNPAWGESETLRQAPAMRAGGEEAISPYFMLVTHMAPEIWLQTMVMGKVFERFPHLAFGIIELGASWLGPAVERMDLWSDFMNKVGVKYDMKPSEYVRRNVRITPFWHENLPLMVERYGLKECYCFSTDYPHLEGGKDPIGIFRKHLRKLDPSYDRMFFAENAKILFPGL